MMGGWGNIMGGWGNMMGGWGNMMGGWGNMMGGWGNMMGGWGNMMGGWGNGGYGYGGYGWMGVMGTIMSLIFGIGIILAIYLFRRNSSQIYTHKLGGQNTGLDILHERYARGEIDSAEFQSKKHDLEGK